MKLFIRNYRLVCTVAIALVLAAMVLGPTSQNASMQAGSNTIVFDRNDSEVGYTKIFSINADGTGINDLGRGYGPSWSGDGSKIAFASGTSETSDIWTMNADGSNRQQLTQNWMSYSPSWSADSQRIAFVSGHENGDHHVYVINADGTGQARLNHTAVGVVREYAPAWSADGTKIIFLGQKVVNGLTRYDYYAADASNSGVTVQLTHLNTLFDHVKPAVHPSGLRIITEYANDLYAIEIDGTDAMSNLTEGSTSSVGYADYAPDGQKVVYTHGGVLHVMNADGTSRTSLDVVGRNADWNPTAVLPGGTPTPTPAITADLAVQASVSDAVPTIGSSVTFSVNVSNNGTDDAAAVSLTAQIPASIVAASPQASQGFCTVSNSQLDCQLGAIADGGSVSVSFDASLTAVGFASVQFTASATEMDPDASNNSASANLNVAGPCAAPVTSPIEVTRSQWRRDDRTGQDELILTVRNRADHNLDPRLMFVFDGLPAGVSIDPESLSGYTQCVAPIGSPYVVAYAPNKREWKPMQTVSIRVLFNNPGRVNITYDYRLFSGSVNP
jgi:uncharacterized repeat protein (TIGR01451 family)